MQLPQSFLQSILKPGRYLGGELGIPAGAESETGAPVVWYYPGHYEDAMADTAWRRGFFALTDLPGVRCVRAVEFAADVWQRLRERSLPPFTLDGHLDIRRAAAIVFWAPDVFAAAHIPSILIKLGLDDPVPTIGVVVAGLSAPRFLNDHVDWVIPAPRGWLPGAVGELLGSGGADPGPCVYQRSRDNWDRVWNGAEDPVSLLPYNPALTPQWVPRVDAGTGLTDLELFGVDSAGEWQARSVADLVVDALAGLRATGLGGVRFCASGFDCAETIAATLIELTRVFNMKRSRVELPALAPADYDQYWKACKPHLIKPELRLRIRPGDDPGYLVEMGRRALNDGWRGLTAVLAFDSFSAFVALLPVAGKVIEGWATATAGFEDRIPLRLKYAPAPLEHWSDPPSEPSESEFRSLCHACRRFREDLPSGTAIGNFRIEDVIARNWLAAADNDLWPRLAGLDLSDPNDDAVHPLDWCAWVRTGSGLTGPPAVGFSRRSPARMSEPHPSGDTGSLRPADDLAAVTKNTQLYGRRKKRARFTRRLAAPDRTRLRVCWGKTEAWRLCSHLDLVRTIERAIRVSGIPAGYSEGFHPRLKLSFGPPLAFGLISRAEFFDVVLEHSVEPADIDALKRAFPPGIFISEAKGLPAQVPSLTEAVNEAVYTAPLPLSITEAQAAIQSMMTKPRIEWTRSDRPGRRPIDPRKSLVSTALEENDRGVVWNLRVSVGREGGIRPADWAALIFDFDPDKVADLLIERTALLIRRGDQSKSPLEFP